MNRYLSALALGAVLCFFGVAEAAVYDDVFWVGGDGEWTGDVTATPEYSTGHWSASPTGPGLPAKFVLGRNDGIRVGQVVGAGGYDLDRVPCDSAAACTTTPPVTIAAGVQLGTDIFITTGATVSYNPNRQFLTGDDALDRFGDWRMQPDANFPGTPTLNLSNKSTFVHQTTIGGDEDGMWTRWNGAALNIDDATFRRSGDEANGFSGGAMMLASYHGYANSMQTVNITNGGRFENEGQLWFGISGNNVGTENPQGISVIMTINDGHLDLTGGDEYELDNDGLPMRADLAFIYDWKHDDDPNVPATLANNETFVINFTGPGTITVDGMDNAPLDTPAAGAGRGGIRVATNVATSGLSNYGTDGDTQRSYQDLWNMGILRANNLSGLTGATFGDYFTVTNAPGQNDYKLTSNVEPVVGVPGDYNGNGTVDAADYVAWRNGGPLQNDPTDGVQPEDFDFWRANFGDSTAGSAGSASAIPEPGSMLLIIAGLASLVSVRPRRNG